METINERRLSSGGPSPRGLRGDSRCASPAGPWLSVIMPTYNGEAYLADALESIARQDLDGVQVLAVDDGSTDGTAAVLEKYRGRLPMSILQRPHCGNWVENSNLGLAAAAGRYACILHQDDCWLPGRLSMLRSLLRRSPDAMLLLHPVRYIDQSGRSLGVWHCPLPRSCRPLPSSLVVPRLLVQNFISMPAPLFRRQAVLDAGGMKPHLWYTADWDLWLTLAGRGTTVYCPRPLACFRVHGHSQTIQSSVAGEEFREQLEEILADHVPRWEETHGPLPAAIRRAARFSVEMNTTLAARFHGQKHSLGRLLFGALSLGPAASARYLRDSRLHERVVSRVRAMAAR